MGRSPVKKLYAKYMDKMVLYIHCPKCGVKRAMKAICGDMTSWSQDCETCGSHGETSVDVECCWCGTKFEVEITSH